MGLDPGTKLTKETLASLPPLCTDGAWGTELQALGAAPGELTDLWNASAPEKVLSVAAAYVEAGARVVLTNTFSSNRLALGRHGLAGRAAELSRRGAEISRTAAAGRAWVFGSVGPSGSLIAMGTVDAAAIRDAAAEQAAALAEGGADAIVIETQVALEEARAALEGCLSACDLPVGVTFSFDSGRDGTRTMMGVRVAEAHALAAELGASFVGANCGAGPDAAPCLAGQLRACGGGLPIWMKTNAGLPALGPDGRACYDAPLDALARHAGTLLDSGVRFLGGCCGSTPGHVRELARALGDRTRGASARAS